VLSELSGIFEELVDPDSERYAEKDASVFP